MISRTVLIESISDADSPQPTIALSSRPCLERLEERAGVRVAGRVDLAAEHGLGELGAGHPHPDAGHARDRC